MATVRELIAEIAARFDAAQLHYGHGTDNAWDEAVYLVTQVLGIDDDVAELEQSVETSNVARLIEVADARITTRTPLAHILCTARYLGMDFVVREGVMIPRSPIGVALHQGQMDPWLPATVDHILDLCAGTGCLGIVAAKMFPQAEVDLLEIDPSAIEICEQNIERHGLSGRVRVIAGDVLAEDLGAPDQLSERYDLILANPPYVSEQEMQELPSEYSFEPVTGLVSGRDGLEHISGILSQAAQYLGHDGLFVGEVGATAPVFEKHFPQLPVIWLDLLEGGEGVFLLEGKDISSHTARQLT